ncbi:hypothetical protein KQI77_04005 [Clostridium sp. MSJ-8]|uniref:hypothetical protein n=1 Tax=Clostridium sp. MSJ-8 TaxID=2841510 RepID=UPI001C0F1CB1|nr:hypothetical protein [Clostridium sp. MSJ-8]MBU5487326.1 hypothetical protein [Clostridium sp. MSJ-8]
MDDKVLIAIVACLFVCLYTVISSFEKKLNKIEMKMDKIAEKLGINEETLSDEVQKEIEELVKQGNLVRAIKIYRMETGVGLKEAKEYIDDLCNNR